MSIGGLSSMAKSLGSLAETDKLMPALFIGHGNPMNKKEFRDYREMVAGTIYFVLAGKEAGKGVSEIIARGLPEKWTPWASDLVPEGEWIKMIYTSKPAEAVAGKPTEASAGSLD